MEGLSAKSVIVSFISQLIVFLYLLDNDTSWMILASSGIGCCIEFWKIGKAMHIEVAIILNFFTAQTLFAGFYFVFFIIFSIFLVPYVSIYWHSNFINSILSCLLGSLFHALLRAGFNVVQILRGHLGRGVTNNSLRIIIVSVL